MNTRRFLAGALLAPALFFGSRSALASHGGGFADAGVQGEYFANANLQGAPAFSRRDVRVRFEWGTNAPGGSTTGDFARVKADNFSARWTGRILPRFSERYTISLSTSDSARVFLDGKLVLDSGAPNAANGVKTKSVVVPMQANKSVDFRMEYREVSGPASLHLFWESPSTPREPIEAATVNAINAVTYSSVMFADAIKMGRDKFEGSTAEDAQGWPKQDGTYIAWEGKSGADVAGTYLLQFNGLAQVNVNFDFARFSPGGPEVQGERKFEGVLPSGAGYDPKTNTTRALMQTRGNDAGILYLNFRDTQRTQSSAKNTGVTNIRLLRPLVPGGQEQHGASELFARDFKRALSHFYTLRWLTANFNTEEKEWSNRRLPSARKAEFGDRGQVWEYFVMLSNETGKDLYITVPTPASNDYMRKLAQLLRFGSDGVNPYTKPTANPKYPPLNPNLNVYVEWTNEFWNWVFAQAPLGVDLARAEVKNNTPEGRILNFDGQANDGDFRRFAALRTVRMSEIFREVWGDENMPMTARHPRVRPVFEYQYTDAQETASVPFRFLDAYFNNGDGQKHVATPRPIPYYIWGAGGATYYGSANPRGYQDAIKISDAGFENGNGWTLSNGATTYSALPAQTALTDFKPGTALRGEAARGTFGFKFTVGPRDIIVYQLGRWKGQNNGRDHFLRLHRADTGEEVAYANLIFYQQPENAFVYARVSRPPVLKANTSYILASDEWDDTVFGDDTQITARAGITIDGALRGRNENGWKFTNAQTGARAFGPLDMKFAVVPEGTTYLPPAPPEGERALKIAGKGEATTTISVPKAGVYALEFTAAANGERNGQAANSVRIFMGGQNATSRGNEAEPISDNFSTGGRWGYDYRDYLLYGTAPVKLEAGQHTIRIAGQGSDEQEMFFDNVRVTSLDAIYEAGIPGKGEALGQVSSENDYQKQLNEQAKHARAWGLNVVAYEGGWSLGGDRDSVPLQSYAKYLDARTKQTNIDSITAFARSGGDMYATGTYDAWLVAGTSKAESYPLLQAIIETNKTLPPASTFGHEIKPSGETRIDVSKEWHVNVWNKPPSLAHRDNGLRAKAVIIRTPSKATYSVALRVVGEKAGGKMRVDVNGKLLKSVDVPQTEGEGALVPVGTVELLAGQHSVMVRAWEAAPGTERAGDVREIVLTKAATPMKSAAPKKVAFAK